MFSRVLVLILVLIMISCTRIRTCILSPRLYGFFSTFPLPLYIDSDTLGRSKYQSMPGWLCGSDNISPRCQDKRQVYGTHSGTAGDGYWDFEGISITIKMSSMRRTEYQQFYNVSRLVLQLSLFNPLQLGVKDRAHLSTFKFFIFEKFSCFFLS